MNENYPRSVQSYTKFRANSLSKNKYITQRIELDLSFEDQNQRT